jgi:hypothetical protein
MPAHGNSFLHHPSCAQVQRQHQQIGGSCRLYPASRHSHSPHQLKLRTFNLSKDPGDLYLGFLRDVPNEGSSVRWSLAETTLSMCDGNFSQLGRSHEQTASGTCRASSYSSPESSAASAVE